VQRTQHLPPIPARVELVQQEDQGSARGSLEVSLEVATYFLTKADP